MDTWVSFLCFFFSSRRRHTRSDRDWSSDVCSSDLIGARGETMIPGLWDMHVHFEQVEWPVAQLAAGVTTARDVGNELELAVGLRDAIRSGRALGPRMLLAGLIDGAPDGLGVQLAGTPDEARAM